MKQIGLLLMALVLLFGVAEAKKRTIYINHEMGNCSGVAKGKCLQYRYSKNGEWQLLHGNIEGFTYEPGYMYTLRINETKLKNPPADGSSIKRKLIKLVSKEAMMSIALPHESISGKWIVTWLYSDTGKENITGKNIMVGFDEETGRVTGKVCNGFGGKLVTNKGNILAISQIMSTKMYCQDMQYENSLITALQAANSYGFEDGLLVFTKDGKPLVAFTATEAATTSDAGRKQQPAEVLKNNISDVKWLFTTMSFDGVAIDLSKSATFIGFKEAENKLAGKASCNNFFGELVVEKTNEASGKIKMDKIGATMMACPDLATEQKMMKTLALVTNYEISGRQLLLKAGNTILFELKTSE